MKQCQIRWVDDSGNQTPDSNPAVAIIRCNGYPVPSNPTYKAPPSPPFPVCRAHLDVMPDDGVWVVLEMLDGSIR